MPSIRRIMSVPMVSVVAIGAIGLTAPIVLAPPATALTCRAPEANVNPPAGSPGTIAPSRPSPIGQLPIGRRPRGANPLAPLPKLGPLISTLLHPGGSLYSAPVKPLQQRAAELPVVPPAPAPPDPASPANQALAAVPDAGPNAPAAQAAPAQPPAAAAPAPPASIAGAPTSLVDWVTGPNGPNKTLERFGISGTDLGIPWENGDPVNPQVLMAFGDTFGYCRVHGEQHRSNTLFRSQDRNLADGITVGPGVIGNKYSGSPILQPGFSKQIIPGVKLAPVQDTMIPTAGISVGGKQYLNFMSVKQWGRDGEWSTNYSAIAVSSDNGQNWGIYPGTVRSSAPENVPRARYVRGNENFQQGAFMRAGDGYVYSFGTPSGRGGSVYLSRVPQNLIPDVTKYQYWNAPEGGTGSWVPNNPAAATPVVPGPVGEMSAQYIPYLKQYLMLHSNGGNDVVARTAPAPQGPWSEAQPLVSSGQMPGGIYAPYIHPWSTGKDLYFTLSLWNAYDVMLMHTLLP